MADFTLDYQDIEEVVDYPVLISEAEDQSEQRRATTLKQLIGFKLTSPVLTKTQYQAYRSHLTGQYGALDSFSFTSPFDDTAYVCRYDPRSFNGRLGGALYQCSFAFKVIRQDEEA